MSNPIHRSSRISFIGSVQFPRKKNQPRKYGADTFVYSGAYTRLPSPGARGELEADHWAVHYKVTESKQGRGF